MNFGIFKITSFAINKGYYGVACGRLYLNKRAKIIDVEHAIYNKDAEFKTIRDAIRTIKKHDRRHTYKIEN